MQKRIFLIGFMGCGKSTLGKALAYRLSWSFIDMDQFFEEKHHCTITDFFRLHGEEAFRHAEQKVVKELTEFDYVVIGTGGGAPCYFDNMEIMNLKGLSIYLKLSPEILFNRLVHAKNHRPLVAAQSNQELLSFIQSKLAEREPFYTKATLILDAGERSVEEYVELIVNSGYLQHTPPNC